jgi:ribosomal protein S1
MASPGGRSASLQVWLITADGFGATATRKDAGSTGIADFRDAVGEDEIVAGRVLSVGEHNNRIQINVALPDLTGPSPVEVTAQQFAPGTTAEFTVTGLTADGKRAFLKASSGAAATVISGRVGRGVIDLATVLTPGQIINGTVIRVGEHRGEPQIEVSMPEFVVPSISEQLAALRVVPNEIFDGVVDHATNFGVFVALGPVSGLVHKSKLPGFSPTAYRTGSSLRVVVLQAGEDPNKPGEAKIGLVSCPAV